MNRSAMKKEWIKVNKQEKAYLRKHKEKEDFRLNRLLQEKVPGNLQDTLDTAFYKAFQMVFEKGAVLIEKTYDKEQLQADYLARESISRQNRDRKSLRAFSRKAKGTGNLNTVLSGISGIGLGVLGIGIPDIFLFTGMILKNVYEIALNFGFDYDDNRERRFILLLIEGALSNGSALEIVNGNINRFIDEGFFAEEAGLNEQIRRTSQCLSTELLYMKFLQGIPVVGAAGGAYDAVCMRRITKYAELKYRRRFFAERIGGRR